MITVKKINNSYKFEDLTIAPIDKNLIQKKLINKEEIQWLDNYHSKVYSNLKSYMNKSEIVKLRELCSNI